METKICSKCGLKKNIEDFRLERKKDKCYLRCECKECERKRCKEYSRKNKEKIKEYKKNYSKINELKIKEYKAEYYKKNKEIISQKKKDYYYNNREKIKLLNQKYRMNNLDKEKQRNKEYYKNNKDDIIKKTSNYKKEKIANDKIFKLKCQLRHTIGMSFYRKGLTKSKRTEEILGIEISKFVIYLIKTYEENYKEKWDWDKLKDVHIDHIIPLSQAITKEDVLKLCNYKNLQLLKKEDNLKKSNKINWNLNME